jgi:serine/threonine-protein kinase
MSGKVTLRVTAGPIQGRSFEFGENDTFLFGRAPDCHAQLAEDDQTASRHHFLLEVAPPRARLRDLGSLNGTTVNGVKHGGRGRHQSAEEAAGQEFPQVDLRDGDQIRVGHTVFEVAIDVPLTCCDCGRVIPAEAAAGCRWIAGTSICAACREKALRSQRASVPGVLPVTARPAPAPAGSAVRRLPCCGKCGREGPPGSPADYVCAECAKAANDPVSVLMESLIQEGAPRSDGPQVAGYEVGRLLGKGGMGAVYHARRKADGREAALKVMLAQVNVDEFAREVFRREIEVTRQLRHPSIVELFEHGAAGDSFWFAMEFCPGGSVDSLMKQRNAPLPQATAVRIALQALEGLAHAHGLGFIHRDLKPENLLVGTALGENAKVTDFGLAKSFQNAGLSGMTATGAVAGTFPFMPREQLTNFKLVKPVSDVWSLGATLYYMLTGRFTRDFGGGKDPLGVILKGGIVPLRSRDPRLSPALAAVVDRSVADDLAVRYPTASEFRDALLGVA